MKQVQVVGGVILNEQNEVLCGLRSETMFLGGLWEFPGGRIEPGETHHQTLLREIREELDCDIAVGDFVAECLHEYPSVKVHLFTYYARIVSGSPSAKEHQRLEWVPADQLPSFSWAPADLPTVSEPGDGSVGSSSAIVNVDATE